MPRIHDASKREENSFERMDSQEYENRLSLGHKFAVMKIDTVLKFVDKYVTEPMPTKEEDDIASGKPIAKARPRQKPTETLTSVSIPFVKENG